MARSRGTKRPLQHANQVYLTHAHELVGRLADLGSGNDLACHLILEHGLTPPRNRRQMALFHLLVHAERATEKYDRGGTK
jgi:hypothetical protein